MCKPLCMALACLSLVVGAGLNLRRPGEEPAEEPVLRDDQGQGPVRLGLSPSGAAGNTRAIAISAWARWPTAANTRACCSAGRGPRSASTQNVELRAGPLQDHGLSSAGWTSAPASGTTPPSSCSTTSTFGLKKNGTFGWTKLTYVADLPAKKQAGPSFGLMAPGYFWIDDVSLVKVGEDVPLTDEPVLGAEESPIAPPGELGADAVRCPECGYRNMPAWKTCYACGTPLEAKRAAATGPASQTDHLVRGQESLRGRHGGRGARHRRPQGAADRPVLRGHDQAAGLGGLRFPQGRPATPMPRTRWRCTSRFATRAPATTGRA